MLRLGWNPAVAVVAVVIAGAPIGFANGLSITRLRLASVTTTLGVGIIGSQHLGAASYVEHRFDGGALPVAIIVSSLAARRS